jgi:hypothetical protein
MSAGDKLRDQTRNWIHVARQRHHGDQGLHALIIDQAATTVQGPAVRPEPQPQVLTGTAAAELR